MDFKLIERAMAFVRQQSSSEGAVPAWGRYQKLVTDHLRDGFNPKPRMPPEYYYAYLRCKGLKHTESLATMGLATDDTATPDPKKPFWKLW
ncbi:MAG: hypothetical protein RIS90_3255 [Pseudomonadota bacterium]|jgi:hypothetical protein